MDILVGLYIVQVFVTLFLFIVDITTGSRGYREITSKEQLLRYLIPFYWVKFIIKHFRDLD